MVTEAATMKVGGCGGTRMRLMHSRIGFGTFEDGRGGFWYMVRGGRAGSGRLDVRRRVGECFG